LVSTPRQTRVVSAFAPPESEDPNPVALASAAHWLARGEPVVIPTETVYGLAAPALERQAVAAIFRIKQRPLDNPLIVHVAEREQLSLIGTELSPLGARLAERFWPGPLTLVVSTQAKLPWVTAGLDSIALREPAHPFARALIRAVGPLAAPSANRSGRPSPTRASHVLEDLQGDIPLVIDGGDLEHGLESTVLDVRGDTPILLRPGAVGLEEIHAALGRPVETATRDTAARSPGMKYRHYSPRAELWLYLPLGSADDRATARLRQDALRLLASGRRVGAIARSPVDATHFIALPSDARAVARGLFAWLRQLDELDMDYVLVEGIPNGGLGRAVMDRLERAATRVARAEPLVSIRDEALT